MATDRRQPTTRVVFEWLRRRGPVVLFAGALAVVVFLGGIQFARTKAFPWELLRSAKITAETLIASRQPAWRSQARPVDLPRDRLEAARIVLRDPSGMADRIVFPGGTGRFAELCPEHPGCIAVEYVGPGQVAHAYPYRPGEIEQAAIVDLPFEFLGDFELANHGYLFAVDTYSNGDLLVVFHYRDAFPYAGGIARIRPDGTPAWYRRDYSHHEPHVAADETVWVPAMRVGQGPLRVDYDAPKQQIAFELPCEKPYVSLVRKIGPDGQLLEEIPVFEKLAASRYRFLLRFNTNPCDPVHVNSVHELGPDAAGPSGIRPGDIVVSLWQLSAFVVLDRDSFDIKTLFRGTFNRQHSVKHLTGSRFVVFDNWGVEAERDGSSRVLVIDLADRSETTVFPGPGTPDDLVAADLFTRLRGVLSVSPDRQKLIVTFLQGWKAFEMEIATGKVLTEFANLHDLSSISDLEVVQFQPAPGPRYVLDP